MVDHAHPAQARRPFQQLQHVRRAQREVAHRERVRPHLLATQAPADEQEHHREAQQVHAQHADEKGGDHQAFDIGQAGARTAGFLMAVLSRGTGGRLSPGDPGCSWAAGIVPTAQAHRDVRKIGRGAGNLNPRPRVEARPAHPPASQVFLARHIEGRRTLPSPDAGKAGRSPPFRATSEEGAALTRWRRHPRSGRWRRRCSRPRSRARSALRHRSGPGSRPGRAASPRH